MCSALNGIGEVAADRPETARVVNASTGDCAFNEHVASCTPRDSPNQLGNQII